MNEMNKPLHRFCEWLMSLAYLNLLWIIFSAAGFIIFGIIPATISMFAVIRQWLMKDTPPTSKAFWLYYKTNFWKGNLLFFPFVGIGYLLLVNFRLHLLADYTLPLFLFYFLLIVSVVYGLIFIYIFPIFVHFEYPSSSYYKNSLLFAFSHPYYSVLLVTLSYGHFLLMNVIPIFLLFFGVSLWSYVMMKVGLIMFTPLQARPQ
ncbi:YesL family protein [Alkalihalobacterium bogoriense]|uniref:YesL family protein n=1 Tax=Alkalihalobacterium bogoriense TaxID=246272 RepID=UPI0004795D4E|nr:DUF624 domain-containing protein [Alkalihalobacterium bogoriense]